MTVTLSAIHDYRDVYATKLAFSPSGILWAACNEGECRVWQGSQKRVTLDISAHAIGSLHFSSDERFLYLSPLIYDLSAQAMLDLPPLTTSLSAGLPSSSQEPFAIHASAWHPTGDTLLIFAHWQTPRRLGRSSEYTGPRKRLLALDGQSRVLKQVLWEGSDATEYETLIFGPSFAAAASQIVFVWDSETFTPLAQLTGHETVVRHMSIHPGDSLLATGDWDGQVIVWDTRQWAERIRWQAHAAPIQALAFHPTQPWIATGSTNGQLKLWSLNAELMTTLEPGGEISALAFHPQDQTLLVAVDDGSVLEYQLTTGHPSSA